MIQNKHYLLIKIIEFAVLNVQQMFIDTLLVTMSIRIGAHKGRLGC